MSARRHGRPVVVVGGGRTCEHDVSLASAASVADGLSEAGLAVTRLTIGRDGVWSDEHGPLGDRPATSLAGALHRIAELTDAVLFPVLHGPHGEDGTLAALAELARVPYVGSGVGAGAIGMDKPATKLLARSLGLEVARGLVLRRGEPVPDWPDAAVVKPVAAGSSHGVALVPAGDPAALRAAIDAALAVDDRALVEEVVTGREVDVAVLRRADGTLQVGPALEIVGHGIFDTAQKYDGSADFRLPADLPDDVAVALAGAARRVYEALGCNGLARVDFFVVPGGRLVLNEVNTVPGMTAHSQAPRMMAAAGWSYPDLLAELVAGAGR